MDKITLAEDLALAKPIRLLFLDVQFETWLVKEQAEKAVENDGMLLFPS